MGVGESNHIANFESGNVEPISSAAAKLKAQGAIPFFAKPPLRGSNFAPANSEPIAGDEDTLLPEAVEWGHH